MKKKKVIFDTNALMAPSEHTVDIFEKIEKLDGSYECIVPESVIAELERLSESSKDAKIGLELARERCIKVENESEEPKEGADDAIVEIAGDIKNKREEEKIKVVTNDIELKERLLEKDIPVFYLRQKKRLEEERP